MMRYPDTVPAYAITNKNTPINVKIAFILSPLPLFIILLFFYENSWRKRSCDDLLWI